MAGLSWKRRVRLLVLGLVAVVALVPFQTMIWDGGFEDAEYRLRFVDGNGRPVPGVSLRVLTPAGGACHLFPINEFLPDGTPTSDADGRMVFHHASHALEFAGRVRTNVVGMAFGDTRSPEYVLAFDVDGREANRVRYGALRPARTAEGSVTRTWEDTDWPAREYLAHERDWEGRLRHLFDGDGDGRLDRAEGTAARYFSRVMSDRLESHRERREVTFLVVERTVVISLPE